MDACGLQTKVAALGMWKMLKRLSHRHDYKMTFEDPEHPFDWTFRCRCGAVTHDIHKAM